MNQPQPPNLFTRITVIAIFLLVCSALGAAFYIGVIADHRPAPALPNKPVTVTDIVCYGLGDSVIQYTDVKQVIAQVGYYMVVIDDKTTTYVPITHCVITERILKKEK